MYSFKNEIIIGDKKISKKEKPFLVAEIGLNHNNDIEIGKRTIQAAKKSGVDAVKFQSYVTEDFIDVYNSEAKFLFDIFKTYELDEKKHKLFQETAKNEGLVFFSTPLDQKSVSLLESLNVPIYKIASGDIVNPELILEIIKTKKPIFLSTGAAEGFEIFRTLEFLRDKIKELCLMYCVSLYPTPIEKLNLDTISYFESFFEGVLGFSDHSEGFLASAIAVSKNASVIEKHFTLDKNLSGPDHQISLNPEEMKLVSEMIYKSFQMNGEKRTKPTDEERNGRFFGRRSIYFENNKTISKRPAIHLKDKSKKEPWEFISLNAEF
jgi:N,N'-diacetyllegionaminate synthase